MLFKIQGVVDRSWATCCSAFQQDGRTMQTVGACYAMNENVKQMACLLRWMCRTIPEDYQTVQANENFNIVEHFWQSWKSQSLCCPVFYLIIVLMTSISYESHGSWSSDYILLRTKKIYTSEVHCIQFHCDFWRKYCRIGRYHFCGGSIWGFGFCMPDGNVLYELSREIKVTESKKRGMKTVTQSNVLLGWTVLEKKWLSGAERQTSRFNYKYSV